MNHLLALYIIGTIHVVYRTAPIGGCVDRHGLCMYATVVSVFGAPVCLLIITLHNLLVNIIFYIIWFGEQVTSQVRFPVGLPQPGSLSTVPQYLWLSQFSCIYCAYNFTYPKSLTARVNSQQPLIIYLIGNCSK